MTPEKKASLAAAAAEEKKATAIEVLQVGALTTVADLFLLCSGNNVLQVQAIVDEIRDALAAEDIRPRHVEGYRDGNWVLMDYGDLVVHVFDKESRDFYDLDRLWGEAERVRISSTV